ncbi:MAG: heterodisulfide reductase-related iron-sulfur binding cluster, partial [Methanobacterium sp.]
SVISKIANLIEMEQNKEKSRCCGAGAGVRSAYPEITEEIATMRVEDAEKVGAKIIVTTCPFCILNLDSACRDDKKVMDISEILLKAVKQCKDIQ